jgi:hypothetical protein
MLHTAWRPITIVTLTVFVLFARCASAQTLFIEPFAGGTSSPSVSSGVSAWLTGMGVAGFRGSAAWLRSTTDNQSGGIVQVGLVFAAPIAGGPPVRPFVGLDMGFTKISRVTGYPSLRADLGLIVRPGARWNCVFETGIYWNRGRPSEWSLSGGLMFPISTLKHNAKTKRRVSRR